ncbi:MAG: hypothetical protein ACRC1F_02390 [Metamycoplasmataceae bacterium]
MKKKILFPSFSLAIIPLITLISCSSTPIVDLRISIRTTNLITQEDINIAVIDYNEPNISIEKKVEILNRLFVGVTMDNFSNFTTETTTNSITLRSLRGFAFGTKSTIKARIVNID